MSLLMEALKKAERAKQGPTVSQAEQSSLPDSTAETTDSTPTPSLELSLFPQEGAAGKADAIDHSESPSIPAIQEAPSPIPDLAPHATEAQNAAPTRVEPTVSALELAPAEPSPPRESVSSAPMATPKTESEAQPQPATSPKPSTPAARHAETHPKAPPQDAGRIAVAQQKAKTVFSAKKPARNRTLLLAGTAVAVALGLAGFGIYYWQITSTSTMLIPVGAPQPVSAAAPPIDVEAPPQPGIPATSAQSPIDKPALSPVEGPAPVAAHVSQPASSAASGPARTEARGGSEPFKENPAIQIRQSAATSHLNPTLGKAYQSFLSGDTGTAQQLYRKVLQQEPNNRDALLGMAAIALKQKQAGQAAAYYSKLLDLDPADPEALAGLIGLQGQSDPTQSESRLKKVLAQNPQADAAHFALGNLYTQQSRWAEAQQSYFRAYSSAPGNADYAFNLAVSLDHLNQSKLALDYYQRALAQPGPASFDKSSVQTRIRELMPLVEK